MPDIDVDISSGGRQRLHYEDSGGDKPAVVFCHSFAMDGSMFAPQLAAFADDYRCITWDQRAHGSSPASAAFDFWDSARDLLTLIEALGLQCPVVVGTSQGGFLALRVAILAPQRLAAVAVLGSSAAAEETAQKVAFEQLHDAFVGGRDGPPQDVLDTIAAISFGDRFDAEPWKRRWRAWPTEQFKYAFRALADRDDLRPRLAEVQVPVLVLHGSKDGSYHPSYGQEICDGVRNCVGFVLVEGGAHFLSATDSEPVNEALRDFFAAHRG